MMVKTSSNMTVKVKVELQIDPVGDKKEQLDTRSDDDFRTATSRK
jgi:hypothetical protein